MNILLAITKYLITISNLIMIACMGYFSSDLRWSRKEDRPSMVGFAWMELSIAVSIVLMWV